MKAAIIAATGSSVAPNIQVVDNWPEPVAGTGEALVRTEAAALNHLDLWVGRGLPGLDLDYPRISGSDACGRVEAVGEGVDESWVGRRVILNAALATPEQPLPAQPPAPPELTLLGEHTQGTMAERFVAPVTNLADVGDADPLQAAAFGLTHLTAWRMLVSRAQVAAGDLVLITGIGGGVALASMGIARQLGCRVVVTSRAQTKLDLALDLGAEAGVLDTGEDWSREVRRLSDGRGVDVCVDSIGAVTHKACLKSLARGGRLVICGCTSGPAPTTDLARLFWNQQSILGSTMGNGDEFRQVVSLFRSGALMAVVDSVHEASDAAGAYARLESGDQFGKVVVSWS
jgi:NADPH:quinone reductase-like Zn-dependent oxidoreductase